MFAPVQLCCLVAEDQALIGMALQTYLEEAGIEVAGPFPSCAEALSWAEARTPALAILDFKLRDGICTHLAKTLLGRGVPVIIYSGPPASQATSRHQARAVWLEKPVDRASL